jgi:putative salt-induced outer membrane protein YdiY
LKLYRSNLILKDVFFYRLASLFLLIVFTTTTLVFPAFGEENAKKKWANQTELTLIQTKGNSDVETLQFKNKLTNNYTEALSSELNFETFYSRAKNETLAERYAAAGRMDYKLGPKLSTALNLGWKRDVFAGLDGRYSVGPILTYRFIDGPNHFFKTEANLDYVYEEYIDNTDDDFLSAGLLAAYEWVLSETVKFTQSVKGFRDFKTKENYQIESITALIAKLNSYFSLKTSYQINHVTDPTPETKGKTDTILAVSLVADF